MTGDFKEKLLKLATDIKGKLPFVKDESNTILSLVLPFFRVLGYDCSNPSEVISQFNAGFYGSGDKIDFAILGGDANPAILVECKSCTAKLGKNHHGQLAGYYAPVNSARFAILTNGIEYNFYADIDRRNIMDEAPFLTVNMMDLGKTDLRELYRFSRDEFSEAANVAAAERLKIGRTVLKRLESEYSNPSDDFVRLMIQGTTGSKANQPAIAKHREVVRDTFAAFVENAGGPGMDEKTDETLSPPANPETFGIPYGTNEAITLITTALQPHIGPGFNLEIDVKAKYVYINLAGALSSRRLCQISRASCRWFVVPDVNTGYKKNSWYVLEKPAEVASYLEELVAYAEYVSNNFQSNSEAYKE